MKSFVVFASLMAVFVIVNAYPRSREQILKALLQEENDEILKALLQLDNEVDQDEEIARMSVDKQYMDYHYSTGTSGTFTNAQTTTADGAVQDARESRPRAMFYRLAGTDKEMDSEELQDILTATSKGADMSSGSVFSLDACRSIIAMLDEDGNGTLNYEEFVKLLDTIRVWKKMFFKFDADRSGTLEKTEVYKAIRSLGYDISSEAMTVMFNRFSERRRYMYFDNFAACLSRVKMMDDMFKKKGKGGHITLTKDEFFIFTLGI